MEFDPFEKHVNVVYDGKQMYSDYESIGEWQDVPLNDKVADSILHDKDTSRPRAQSNIYS